MSTDVYNFNPGPAALPKPVLQQVQHDLLDFGGSGMSILEMSHRSSIYDEIHNQAIDDLRTLLGFSDDYDVLFMGGGAKTQFALIPMNLIASGTHAEYLVTGNMSLAALSEAQKISDARELFSGASSGYSRLPQPHDYQLDPDAAYLHYASNNTIAGTQFACVPACGDVPLVCDMSSDILSRPVDISKFGLIYAGAQKNAGPAGVTLVVIRRDLLERCPEHLPSMLNYAALSAHNSMLNTPPVFAIYMVGLVLQHVLEMGGLEAMAARNAAKAQRLYDALDASEGFYQGCVHPDSRSLMNVTFRLPTEALEAQFVKESTAERLVGLKGHRSVGGIRASLYNAVEPEAVEALVDFMDGFRHRWN